MAPFHRARAHLHRHPGLLLWAAAGLFQLGVFGFYALRTGTPFVSTLEHFDANWYLEIVDTGRGPVTDDASLGKWAFLPLTLLLVSGLKALTAWPSSVLGALLSLLAGGLAFRVLERVEDPELPRATPWGFFLLAWSPASHVLFTFHTEALFLLASAVAVATYRRWPWASALALAAAVATRNQGVFVVLWILALCWRARLWRALLLNAAVAAAGWALMVAWMASQTGRPFVAYEAQRLWPHANGVLEVVQALWMGNASQLVALPWVVRHLYALAWLGAGAWMLRAAGAVTGAYVLVSAGVMLFQGTLQNAFRFSVVCFPLFFFLGERVAKAPRWAQAAALALWLTLHQWCLNVWLRDGWPY